MKNKPSTNFFTRLCKLASTCELADKNIEIRDQFIDKCSSNRLCRRLLQEPNLTPEKTAEKAQAMKLADMVRMKVTQDKHDFPSNKCCLPCGSSTNFTNKCNKVQKEKHVENVVRKDIFQLFANKNLRNYQLNLLENKSSSDE